MQSATHVSWRFASALALGALLALGQWSGNIPILVALAYVLMGLTSFAACGIDKRSAQNGQWRISEATLHCLDLAFGIVGGLMGQALFRHKTRKRGYVAATLFILTLHLLFLVGMVTRVVDLSRLASAVR